MSTTMSSTTLSAAVSVTDRTVTVASATGITAKDFRPNTLLYIDRELMEVVSLSGTVITVNRGMSPTKVSAHNSGATVWLGPPASFADSDPEGAAPSDTTSIYLPTIVPRSGKFFYLRGTMWVEESAVDMYTRTNVGTAATGVTAVEYGNGRFHITKLTFTALLVGSPVGAANLAIGVKVYDLPAGAIQVGGTSMSVALADASVGALDVADTPDVGIGLLIGSGAQAVLSGVGATAENYLTGQTAGGCAAAYTSVTLANVTTEVALAAAAAHTVHLNAAATWTGAGTIKATGTIILTWIYQSVS
mgnify:CR=1 FL=1